MKMLKKPVSLTVHRNNMMQRRAKQLRDHLRADIRELLDVPGIKGYALVAWNDDCHVARWSTTGSRVCANTLPDYVRGALRRSMEQV